MCVDEDRNMNAAHILVKLNVGSEYGCGVICKGLDEPTMSECFLRYGCYGAVNLYSPSCAFELSFLCGRG